MCLNSVVMQKQQTDFSLHNLHNRNHHYFQDQKSIRRKKERTRISSMTIIEKRIAQQESTTTTRKHVIETSLPYQMMTKLSITIMTTTLLATCLLACFAASTQAAVVRPTFFKSDTGNGQIDEQQPHNPMTLTTPTSTQLPASSSSAHNAHHAIPSSGKCFILLLLLFLCGSLSNIPLLSLSLPSYAIIALRATSLIFDIKRTHTNMKEERWLLFSLHVHVHMYSRRDQYVWWVVVLLLKMIRGVSVCNWRFFILK